MNNLHLTELANKVKGSPQARLCADAIAKAEAHLEVEGCEGALGAMVLADAFRARPALCLAVVPQESDCAELAMDLAASGLPSTRFPWWGALPYREISPLSAVFADRARALARVAGGNPGVVIVPQRAFLAPLPPPEYTRSLQATIRPGTGAAPDEIARLLASLGYERAPRAQARGEFALRGEVLDIFMDSPEDGESEAYRVLFDFDKIESIRRLDPFAQDAAFAKESLPALALPPMREVVWSDERIEALEASLRAAPEFSEEGAREIIEELIARRTIPGEEMLYPLAFAKSASLLDYLGPNDSVALFDRERLDNAQESIEREYKNSYARSRREEEREYPLPERLLFGMDALLAGAKARRVISFLTMKSDPKPGMARASVRCDPSRSFFGEVNYLRDEFAALLGAGWQIVVAAESEAQALRIRALLAEHPALSVIAAPISSGFALEDARLMIVQENEIFGRRKRAPRSLKNARSSPIDTFIDLAPGDYVVHVNHGIGLFQGIERKSAMGYERDYVKLAYAGEETIFVPVEQVDLVQRYVGNQGAPPRLDTIGSRIWENRKGKVRQAVEELAQRLIDLYSKRKRSQGFAFPGDGEWQTMFEAAFPYEETEDQLRCVQEIKRDMESGSPMDRLVCGDVGFGKTEVALRACFKAIMGGRQAVFLAPTTILAEQHYGNFRERFSRFPVRIAMLSRFVDPKTTRTIIEQVKKGHVDLLIGTHRVIQKDISFKNLGLIVIDEEQRFGVKDKERLKEMKTNVDCLTLSATPIPRTLHMSLLKIRDMSLLTTPPGGRRPIETSIEEYSDERLISAIRREAERGGQVFFLHNRIESLRETRIKIEKLVPEMLVETAHGQMDPRDLEEVMRRFVNGGFHVLVSTTIIENGIDIPNVNTIIIDRADSYGVSQLYQLRGRVGRSDRAAYAYLLYPGGKAITELAMKRLQVLSDFTELGAGFKIAMKDMEIRGAGNLLGRDQSGDMYSVGFDMYLRLLDDAVRRLENSEYEAETETLLDLEYSGFVPDGYVDTPREKMEVYKMIASVRDKDELERVYSELIRRFGPLPDEAASLMALAEIRIICRELAVSSLREREGVVRAEFARVSRVKVERLVRLMQESAGKVRLDPKMPNVVLLHSGGVGLKEKSEFLREKLAALIA
ncbi:MAG: transcription-repair coupling factor [Treponema sp.]|nr:transcription-repair coupling factor [Treponema sp.]